MLVVFFFPEMSTIAIVRLRWGSNFVTVYQPIDKKNRCNENIYQFIKHTKPSQPTQLVKYSPRMQEVGGSNLARHRPKSSESSSSTSKRLAMIECECHGSLEITLNMDVLYNIKCSKLKNP